MHQPMMSNGVRQLTEFNGWVGFRDNTTTGFQDLGGIVPSTLPRRDGAEAVGIESMYFPAVWSVGNGGGYLDHLLSANGTPQALGTIVAPVTISPDGSAIQRATGPDAYLTERPGTGAWQIPCPSIENGGHFCQPRRRLTPYRRR